MTSLGYRVRLTETIAWCLGQKLKSSLQESDEVLERRRKIEQANELVRRAHSRLRIRENRDFGTLFKSPEYREAQRLWSCADPSSIAPLKDQLRTPFLRPSSTFSYPHRPSETTRIVEDMATRRADLLKTAGQYPEPLQVDLDQGRLLLYAPEENLADGAAQYPSKGFFDVDNVPPWDTWVCYVEKYVVSWVSPILEELVTAGIEVNPEECIKWASPEFAKSLIAGDSRL